jgi:hypothetical protein
MERGESTVSIGPSSRPHPTVEARCPSCKTTALRHSRRMRFQDTSPRLRTLLVQILAGQQLLQFRGHMRCDRRHFFTRVSLQCLLDHGRELSPGCADRASYEDACDVFGASAHFLFFGHKRFYSILVEWTKRRCSKMWRFCRERTPCVTCRRQARAPLDRSGRACADPVAVCPLSSARLMPAAVRSPVTSKEIACRILPGGGEQRSRSFTLSNALVQLFEIPRSPFFGQEHKPGTLNDLFGSAITKRW